MGRRPPGACSRGAAPPGGAHHAPAPGGVPAPAPGEGCGERGAGGGAARPVSSASSSASWAGEQWKPRAPPPARARAPLGSVASSRALKSLGRAGVRAQGRGGAGARGRGGAGARGAGGAGPLDGREVEVVRGVEEGVLEAAVDLVEAPVDPVDAEGEGSDEPRRVEPDDAEERGGEGEETEHDLHRLRERERERHLREPQRLEEPKVPVSQHLPARPPLTARPPRAPCARGAARRPGILVRRSCHRAIH